MGRNTTVHSSEDQAKALNTSLFESQEEDAKRSGQQEAVLARSSTLPTPSALPRRSPLPQLLASEKSVTPRRGSIMGSPSPSIPLAKSKGVQMVSEMRARVRNLELKIHSRVPRLRLGSFSKSTAPRYLQSPSGGSTIPLSQRRESTDRISLDTKSRTSGESMGRAGAESPGWVLILEETPVRRGKNSDSNRRKSANAKSI